MKSPKQIILRTIFALEVVLFTSVYWFGAHGIVALQELQQEHATIVHEMEQYRIEIAALEQEVAAWQTEPFYAEKVAREQLQMARAQEEVYFLC